MNLDSIPFSSPPDHPQRRLTLASALGGIRAMFKLAGEDGGRQGLRETPLRFLRAWQEHTSGYSADVPALLKTFEDGAEHYDQIVLVKGIPFYSLCEHHLAPFFGHVTIGYLPNRRIVGLSKLARVTDAFAKRLQVQERLTSQIADAIHSHLEPQGVGVVASARHLCMESRGVKKQGHSTTTSAMRGQFLTNSTLRQEFLALCRQPTTSCA